MSNFKSLLGLNEIAADSLSIANLDLTNTNIVDLNTDRVPEDADPINLYYTDGRFDTCLTLKSTTDIKEGSNLYYTVGRFDTTLSNKSTSDLKEGTNLYYTDGRFDARLLLKTTADLKEGTNLYYTTARAHTDFDARLLSKSTADLKEGTNLYTIPQREQIQMLMLGFYQKRPLT